RIPATNTRMIGSRHTHAMSGQRERPFGYSWAYSGSAGFHPGRRTGRPRIRATNIRMPRPGHTPRAPAAGAAIRVFVAHSGSAGYHSGSAAKPTPNTGHAYPNDRFPAHAPSGWTA